MTESKSLKEKIGVIVAEVEQIKAGYKEMAKIIGENKGTLDSLKKDFDKHVTVPDAHNPAYLSRNKDAK